MKQAIVEIKSRIGVQMMQQTQVLFIKEEHNIPCHCNFGTVENWIGWSKTCPDCKGTYSLGTYYTMRMSSF